LAPAPEGGAGGLNDLLPPFFFSPKTLQLCDLEVRFPRLYIPSDFCVCINSWTEVNSLKEHTLRTLFQRTPLGIDPAPCPSRGLGALSSQETSCLAKRYNARVLLSLGLDCNDGDQSADLYRHVRFLLGRRKGSAMLLGGPWVPSLDGKDVEGDEGTLIRTAVRTVGQMTGLDLSRCETWRKLYEVGATHPHVPRVHVS
jgi:hypothetical protein